MSVFDFSGIEFLSKINNLKGFRVYKAYDLGGDIVWSRSNQPTVDKICNDWKFKLVSVNADTSYSSTAEAAATFNDESWDTVSIPHDWSIYNDFNPKSKSTYEGGFLDGGDAWYRTKFEVDADLLEHDTYLYFDGVYMESTVYINGKEVGKNYHGYNPFWFDISEYLVKGSNSLAVFVRNNQPSSRWYSGSGIYRPVYLVALESADFSINNVCITTPNLETEKDGDVTTHVEFELHNFANESSAIITGQILKDGIVVKEKNISLNLSSESINVKMDISVTTPDLWDIYTPNLYQFQAIVRVGTREYFSSKTTFGYRYFNWDVNTGFWLNGVQTKIKGVCMHHDLGCIGAEANHSAMERQIDILINMGCNAIRLTHNPASTMFMDLCAEKGVMCVEELFDMWTVGKNTLDFHRFFDNEYETVIKNTAYRDRNNPALIMWSLGNEINRTAKYTGDQVRPIVTKLITAVKKYDSTRPCTMGEDSPSMEAAKVCMQLLDVCGINYNQNNLTIPHGLGKPCYGSETTSALSSRGIYARDNTKYQCSSLDDDKVSWGSYAGDAVKAHMESAYSGGMFVWTGFDYIGEPTPFNKYPTKSSYFGIVDLAGFPKDIYYMYQSQWSDSPMVHILPRNIDSYTDGQNVNFIVYSNCESIELFIDDVSQGTLTKSDISSKYQFIFSVAFKKGTYTVKGYDSSGSVVATDEISCSTGIPTKLRLTAYKITSVSVDSDDLVFITCDVLDENNIIVPVASNKVTFGVSGGTVLGTDNGNAACVENMRSNTRSTFCGKCLCVVRHDGNIGKMTITAKSDGLASGKIDIDKTAKESALGNLSLGSLNLR